MKKQLILLGILSSTLLLATNVASASFWTRLVDGFGLPIDGLSTIMEQQFVSLPQAESFNHEALRLALTAYEKARQEGIVQKPILTIIDYSKPATEPRMLVLDLQHHNILFQLHVAHGKNSGDNIAKSFSNRPSSLASSLGVFVTGDTYRGKHGYSLRLKGLERGFNDNALARAIVIHGANYVGPDIASRYGRIGRSWGCPAVNEKVVAPLINFIKGGSMVFAYYPDKRWLNHSDFLKA